MRIATETNPSRERVNRSFNFCLFSFLFRVRTIDRLTRSDFAGYGRNRYIQSVGTLSVNNGGEQNEKGSEAFTAARDLSPANGGPKEIIDNGDGQSHAIFSSLFPIGRLDSLSVLQRGNERKRKIGRKRNVNENRDSFDDECCGREARSFVRRKIDVRDRVNNFCDKN